MIDIDFIKRKLVLLGLCSLFLSSCNENYCPTVLGEIFSEYKQFKHKTKEFTSSSYVKPKVVIYRGEMAREQYNDLISQDRYIENCLEFRGAKYENMQENNYPFEVSDVKWWKKIYGASPDLVGHYDCDLSKFTSCSESRQFKYAFSYSEGYCYLIIERTLSD